MVWWSAHAPVEIGGVPLHGLVARAAAAYPERTALVDGASGAAVTYAGLTARIDTIAGWLAGSGFGRGDTVALWLPNVPPFAAFALAAMSLGGTVAPLNPALTFEEAAAQLGPSANTVVVTTPALARTAAGLRGVTRCVVVGEATALPGTVTLADVLAWAGPRPGPVEVADDAVAALFGSSGTTGLPKAVELTHANLVAVCRQLTGSIGIDDADVTLAVAPFFHILGFTAELMAPLSAGATVVTQHRFEPMAFADLLRGHRVTYLAVPPPVAAVLARHPACTGLDTIRLVAVGGAAFAAGRQRELAARLPGAVVGQGYGLTETSGAISIPTRKEGSAPGTVGRLIAGTELRVVDPTTGADLAADTDGELWVRGPQVMAGYRGNPEATAAMVDPDGWLRTGDLGHVTPDGDIVIVDRLKDLIKVNAMQVSPAELEALLVTHPAIADAAVVGRDDERTGQRPVAVVVARSGARVDPDEVIAWAGARIAPYKRLAGVHVVDALPRTPSGKLLRRLLDAGG